MCRCRSHRRLGISVAMVGVAVTGGAAAGQVKLTDRTAQAGLTATHQPDELGFPGPQEWMTGGLGVGDFNNDGWMDVFWISGGTGPDRLFINNGDGTFTDQGPAWGLGDVHCGNGVAVGDYNGDGHLDIYVLNRSQALDDYANALFLSNGDGTFADVTASSGTGNRGTSLAVMSFDYDADGYQDIYGRQ